MVRHFVILSILLGGFVAGCRGPGPTPPGRTLDARATFPLEGILIEDKDLSGIATDGRGTGIIVADEGATIQTLRFPGDGKHAEVTGRIVLDPAHPELDLEGAAFMDGWFYVTGSHGTAKKKGTYDEPRARVYRFRLAGPDAAATEVQRASLAPRLDRDDALARFHRQPLQRRGVNVEGLAARAGDLYFGLRSPNLRGNAIVLRVNADELFAGGETPLRRYRVPVGRGKGIRAMESFRDGFLLVVGNAGSEPSKSQPVAEDFDPARGSDLLFWSPDTGDVRRLGSFPSIKKGKEEALLVASAGTEAVVLYDGLRGGNPTRMAIPTAAFPAPRLSGDASPAR